MPSLNENHRLTLKCAEGLLRWADKFLNGPQGYYQHRDHGTPWVFCDGFYEIGEDCQAVDTELFAGYRGRLGEKFTLVEFAGYDHASVHDALYNATVVFVKQVLDSLKDADGNHYKAETDMPAENVRRIGTICDIVDANSAEFGKAQELARQEHAAIAPPPLPEFPAIKGRDEKVLLTLSMSYPRAISGEELKKILDLGRRHGQRQLARLEKVRLIKKEPGNIGYVIAPLGQEMVEFMSQKK